MSRAQDRRAGHVLGMGACLLALMLVALVVLLSACGASGRDMPPAPVGPNEWRETGAEYLYEACTPAGDRVYGYTTASGGIALAVVPGGCASGARS